MWWLVIFLYIFQEESAFKRKKNVSKTQLDIIMHYAFEEFYEEQQMYVYSSQIR